MSELRYDDPQDDIGRNPTDNPDFAAVVAARMSRRAALRGLMAQLVRVEERGNAVRAEVARVAGELATLRGEIGVLRERASRTGFTVGAVERVFWLVVAGLVAWLSGGGK